MYPRLADSIWPAYLECIKILRDSAQYVAVNLAPICIEVLIRDHLPSIMFSSYFLLSLFVVRMVLVSLLSAVPASLSSSKSQSRISKKSAKRIWMLFLFKKSFFERYFLLTHIRLARPKTDLSRLITNNKQHFISKVGITNAFG